MSAFTVSDAILSANRANAQLSTGPRTEDGKRTSAQNAHIHGAYSKAVLLPGDDLALYEVLGTELEADLLPNSDAEIHLFTEIHESTWRMTRIVSIERSTLFLKTELNMDAIKTRFADRISDPAIIRQLAQAEAYSTNARLFGQLHREEKRLRTLVDTKRDELLYLREQREEREFAAAKQNLFDQKRPVAVAPATPKTETKTKTPPAAAPSKNPVRSVSAVREVDGYEQFILDQMAAAKK